MNKIKTFAPLLLLLVCLTAWPMIALSADEQGAYTRTNAVAEGYVADAQSGSFVSGLDGTDTLSGLEDPVATFGAARLFSLYDPDSSSLGTKLALSLTPRFSNAGANATVWVVYYYFDGVNYNLVAIDDVPGGTLDAIAGGPHENADYLGKTETLDSYAATHAVPVCTAISAGTVDLVVGSR